MLCVAEWRLLFAISSHLYTKPLTVTAISFGGSHSDRKERQVRNNAIIKKQNKTKKTPGTSEWPVSCRIQAIQMS